jgi:hypothetical protein
MDFSRLIGTFSIVAVTSLATIAHAAESTQTSIPAGYNLQHSVVSSPVVPSTPPDAAETGEDECE